MIGSSRWSGPAALAALACLGVVGASRAEMGGSGDAPIVSARSLMAVVTPDPWRVSFVDAGGGLVLAETASRDGEEPGALGFRSDGVWRHATRAVALEQRRAGEAIAATVETDDPDGRALRVVVSAQGDGVIAVSARVEEPDLRPPAASSAALEAVGVGFDAPSADERFFGLGERADRVEHRGDAVESYVSDGPYQPDEYGLIGQLLPKPGFRPRADATYFPIPWILSSRGYGVLVDNDETAIHRLTSTRADVWSVEVRGAPEDLAFHPAPRELDLRVFAGPTPAAALERFSARVGRQPRAAAPWVFGPWFQPGGGADAQIEQVRGLRAADAPVSVAQTYLHYLPCGGDRSGEPRRTSGLHGQGVAVTTYFNPMVCKSFAAAFDRAARLGALLLDGAGEPYTYTYFTSRPFVVGQYDLSGVAGRRAYAERLADAVADGHDGWMEDFGEYTPLDGHTADGRDGSASHNRSVVDYHCGAFEFARTQSRPIVRFQRSGWTGAARCAQVVWGGDPTTGWGFDGLASAVRAGLGMGLSGVSTWGSDIGGFFSFFGRVLTPELLARWVQVGAFSGVMRTERDGIGAADGSRPQVDDPQQIANWRRYAKLRTQLYPYIAGAEQEYQQRGLPLMRHLVLLAPTDPLALERDDEFAFGPDILVAPVLDPGATERTAYLPAGTWIDLWRSAHYVERDGSIALDRAALLEGGRSVTVPAPLDEVPLFVRAGAVVPLLPADVDTLADYGERTAGLVHLGDGPRRRELLAFPRGSSHAALDARAAVDSAETASGFELRFRGPATSWTLHASLGALERPFVPCALEWGGERLPGRHWSYDARAQVLNARFAGGSGTLAVRGDCRGGAASRVRPPSQERLPLGSGAAR